MFGWGHLELLIIGIISLAIPVVLIYLVFRGYRNIIGRLERLEKQLLKIGGQP